MKKSLLKSLFCFLFILPFATYGQDYNWKSELRNPDADYFEIYNAAMAYFDTVPDSREEQKLFYRWNSFWYNRVGDENDPGSFHPAYMSLLNAFNEIEEICPDSPENAGSWKSVGPNSLPLFNFPGQPIPFFTANGIGWVQKVYCDQNDPSGNTIYAGSKHGGLFRTQNALAANPNDVVWEHLTKNSRIPGLGIRDMIVAPNGNIFATTGISAITGNEYGVGLIKSTDNGISWEQTPLTISPGNFKMSIAIAIDPIEPETLFVAVQKDLYRSTDGGNSFEMVFQLEPDIPGGDFNSRKRIQDIVFKPGDSNTIYVSGKDGGGDDGQAKLYISTVGGELNSFNEVLTIFDNDPNPPGPQELIVKIDVAVSESEPNWVYLAIVTNAQAPLNTRIAKSENSGIDWNSHQVFTGGTIFLNDIAASPNNPETIFVGGVLLRRSLDEGNAFTVVTTNTFNTNNWVHDDKRDIEIIDVNGTDIIYVAHDGGVARSNDNGNTWINIHGQGLNIAQFYGIDVSTDGSSIVGGCQDEGYMAFIDNDWIDHQRVGDAYRCEFDPYDKNIVYGEAWGGGNPNIQRSQNGGVDWGNFNPNPNMNKHLPCPIEAHDNRTLYFAADQVFQREFGGGWEQVGSLNTNLLWAMAVAPSDYNVIYTASKHQSTSGGELFKTINAEDGASANWTNITGDCDPLLEGGITDIEIDPSDSERLWISLTRFNNGHKVYFSPTGGIGPNAWINVSGGLPNFPANTLAYQEGTNDVLYVGTDVGVFVNTNASDPNSSWQCFNEGLPTTIISDLEINYCKRKLIASTYGNGVWEVDLLSVPQIARSIDEDETWESGTERILNTDLVIEPGVTLTIKGKVNVAEGRKIVVKPNGRLSVNGGHLTSICGPWQGVVVIGDSNKNQFTYSGGNRYQGIVHVINEAIIENAIVAVSLYDIDNPSGTTGGIVIGENSSFINNGRAIVFHPYTNTNLVTGEPTSNLSRFKDCDFTVDDEIQITFNEHIFMREVSGIDFRACGFENIQDLLIYYKGHAIYSVDANFSLEGLCEVPGNPCSQWTRSSVNGFAIGIRAVNSGLSTHTFRVDRTDFDLNYYGTYSSAVNNLKITRCTLKVGLTSLFFYPAMGVYINGGTGYSVESNNFEGFGFNGSSMGTFVRETGNDHNQIYLDKYDELAYANYSNGDNRNEDNPFLGLHYLCNKNQVNTFDFVVPDQASNSNGIAQNQGSKIDPAGNTFSFFPGTNESDFLNQSEWAVVYWHNTNPLETPDDFSTLFFPIATQAENECKNRYPDGPEHADDTNFSDNETQFYDNDPLYKVKITQRNNLIDGGNTQSLINSVNSYQSGEGLQLKTDMMALSPYLSYNVLVAVADRDDILSQVDIYDIMIANPDESIHESLLNYLETKSNPMPSNMVDSLRNQVFQGTTRTELESEISYYGSLKESAANFILHHFLTDTTIIELDSIHQWLDNKGGLTSDYIKVDAYLHENNTIEASQQLIAISQNYSFSSSEELAEFNHFSNLKNLQINLLNQGRSILEFDATEVQQLEQIAANSKWLAGQQAQNILNFAYGHDMIPDPIMLQASGARLEGDKSEENSSSLIYAFPNPGDDLITFQYSLNDYHPSTSIHIFDNYGRKINELRIDKKQGFINWYTQDVKPGLYFYSIAKGNHVLGSGQVVITH